MNYSAPAPINGVGVIAAAVILLIAFGSLLAMGLPIATALLGLGVGIDYALFIVTRFREGLRAGTAPEAAAVTAMRTAGRSVLVAGATVVMVSQNGWLGSVFGFPEKVPVTTWVPMFLFGLSMDYEVFLLSRVREEYDSCKDNAAAVARGLFRTARVITAAAAG